jgi:hypothetical protein
MIGTLSRVRRSTESTELRSLAHFGLDLSQIEGQVRDSSVKKIGEVVNAHPDEALAIIRTWLHQPV